MKQSIKTPKDLRDAIDECFRNDGHQAYLGINSPKYVLIKDFQRDITNVLCSVPDDIEFGELSCFDFGGYNSFAVYVTESSFDEVKTKLAIIIHSMKEYVKKNSDRIRKCVEDTSKIIDDINVRNKEFNEKRRNKQKNNNIIFVVFFVLFVMCSIIAIAAAICLWIPKLVEYKEKFELITTLAGVLDFVVGGGFGIYDYIDDRRQQRAYDAEEQYIVAHFNVKDIEESTVIIDPNAPKTDVERAKGSTIIVQENVDLKNLPANRADKNAMLESINEELKKSLSDINEENNEK